MLSLSMWLTEKKVGSYFQNKILCAVGKVARAGWGGLEQPMAEGQHFCVLGACEIVDPWFDADLLLGGFCTLFVLDERFLRADVINGPF
jgi:hypothetical protein